jgi:alpha-tubulin suppressor-like RCC1 family protein
MAATTLRAQSARSAWAVLRAVTSTGRLLTWGRNFEGQLGIGSSGNSTGSPTPVVTTTGLTTVAGFWAGDFTTFAVDPSGQVWTWGDNGLNQRGNNTGNTSPAMVVGPSHVISIGPGFEHTIAATADGAVWGWGLVAAFGVQLPGNFGLYDPILVPGMSGVAKLAGGNAYSLALTWGSGLRGRL